MESVLQQVQSRATLPAYFSPLEHAIWRTVSYADLFDYPVTAVQIHRYLESMPASVDEVVDCLQYGRLCPTHLTQTGNLFTIAGRESLIQKRARREMISRRLWPAAVKYGRLIAHLPFVKMVALTGSLTMSNVESDADIDYLIVTENGRLWLSRAFIIGIVYLASRQQIVLCPNYIITERVTQFPEQNLYTAREIAQMIPLAGSVEYGRLRQQNQWVNQFLPNAQGSPHPKLRKPIRFKWLQRIFEIPFRTQMGTWLEEWEMQRKIKKFHKQHQITNETSFCSDWCKGHFDGHQQQTLSAFETQLNSK